MATPIRRAAPSLEHELYETPYRFDVFQAVRLLQRLRPGCAPVGGPWPPDFETEKGAWAREAVRFRARTGLAFPPSQIHDLEPPDRENPSGPSAMTVALFGLTGPQGVLPHCYTELIVRQAKEYRDDTLAAFLDLFNHRMMSFFYRAWERSRPPISYERGDGGRLGQLLYALIGLGTDGLRGRHSFPDESVLPFAGALARGPRPAVLLEQTLRDQFGLPIVVESFVGKWLTLDRDDRSTLGPREPKNALGGGLILGARVWDAQGTFRLVIGPLSLDQFRALDPSGPTFKALAQMTRLFVGGELDFEVQLVLRAEDVPPCELGKGSRLGRDGWLRSRSRPFTEDARQAIFPSGV